jgi:hypothetical protein
MSDDWTLAMHAAIARDARAATVPEPDDGGVRTVHWERVTTPGGGWIDHQLVSGWIDGRRRRLLVIDFDSADPAQVQRIEAALRMLSEC